jgi:hypothetical protein
MNDDPDPFDAKFSGEEDLELKEDFGIPLSEVPEKLRVHAKKYPNPQKLESHLVYLRKLKLQYKSGHPELEMWINATQGLFDLEKWYKDSGTSHVRL